MLLSTNILEGDSTMKLVIINDMLWGGGRERRIVQLIAGLNRISDIEITLILLDDRIDYPEVYDLRVNIIKIKRNGNRDFSVFQKIHGFLKKIRPDLVNPWSYMSTFYVAPVARMLGIPCIGAFVVDAKAPNPLTVNWLGMKTGFWGCQQIVGNSIAGHEAYGTPKNKRIVIYNGFDEKRLARIGANPSSEGDQTVRIAMIGRLDRQKDYRTYLDSLSILRSRGVDFQAFVAGQGDQIDVLKEYAEQTCGGQVKFMGFIRDIDNFISSIDIGVLCTDPKYHAEGISNSLLETMAQGKPVVATDGGGTPEIVADGINGYLVKPYDAMMLADRLQQLCTDNDMRKYLGANSSETVATKFSLNNMATSFLRVFNENISHH